MSIKDKSRISPHNMEAEQSVLGCVLIDEEASHNILNDLKAEDFYAEAHKIIFDAMHSVFIRNAPVDFVTLTDELEKKNMTESVGGVEYITQLTNAVPSASNYKHYQEIVKRCSILRKLISASNSISEFAYNGVEAREALAFAEKNIFTISQNEDRSSLAHIKDSVSAVMDKFEAIQKDRGSLQGLGTGIRGIDNKTNGLQKSDLILIAARPACGKTSLALNIVTNAAVLHNARIAVFSLEMPKVQLAQRALCGVGYVNLEKAIKGTLNVNEWKALWAANEKLSKSDIYIDDSSLNSPAEILSKCRRLKTERGLDLVMIDYLQLMNSGSRNKDANRQQEVSEITRSLKIIAKELDVPVIVLSQLSRAVESRSGHRPQLSDLRESGAIEQDADIVMFIHRRDLGNDVTEADRNSKLTEIIIAKHRNGPVTEVGEILVKWMPEYTSFVNLDKDNDMASLENLAPPPVKNDSLDNLTGDDIVPLDEAEDLTDIF